MELVVKTETINIKTIIDSILNRESWGTKYTLYASDDFEHPFTMEAIEIDIERNAIRFKVKYNWYAKFFYFNYKDININVFINLIKEAMEDVLFESVLDAHWDEANDIARQQEEKQREELIDEYKHLKEVMDDDDFLDFIQNKEKYIGRTEIQEVLLTPKERELIEKSEKIKINII